jgi:hypothetical protein
LDLIDLSLRVDGSSSRAVQIDDHDLIALATKYMGLGLAFAL